MINHQERFIFVHIPKTAGSSVTQALGSEWQNHKDLERYRKELEPETFDSFFKFAIVRNPWERLLSDYVYQRRASRHRGNKLHLFDEKGRTRKFRDWVRVVLDDPFHYEARTWGGTVSKNIHRWSPQYDWLSVDGELAVDYVGRMESLDEDFKHICRTLGRPTVDLPHCKRRFHWHYSHYYDAGTRDLVADHWRKDIETFGYEFAPAKKTSRWFSPAFFFARLPLFLTSAQVAATCLGGFCDAGPVDCV